MRTKRLFLAVIAFGLFVSSLHAQETRKNEQNTQSVSGCVVVIGAVRAPAWFALRRRIRLAEVLAIAGGMTDRAGPRVEIMNSGTKCPHNEMRDVDESSAQPAKPRFYQVAEIKGGDETLNPYLQDGDLIIVSELDSVYILGAVIQPRQLFLKSRMTLMDAIKSAGGLTREAKAGDVTIYRQLKNSPQTIHIVVNLDAIRRKRAKDPALQPNDIVNVPGLHGRVGSPFSVPIFDTRPLVPPTYRVIYQSEP